MRLKMKNGSHRYDINRTNPRRGHKYTNFFWGGGGGGFALKNVSQYDDDYVQ